MPTQFEEAVVPADIRQTENLGPDSRNCALRIAPGRLIGSRTSRLTIGLGRSQGDRVFDGPILEPPAELAGSVHTSSRARDEGIRQEALDGQPRLVHVAIGNGGPADMELANDADRHGLTLAVEYVDPRV